MKLLLFYSPEFWFQPFQKTVEEAPDCSEGKEIKEAVVVFYHCEAEDVEERKKILTKALKNIKWVAGKFQNKRVVFHSFSHLSKSKAPQEFASSLIAELGERLEGSGYEVANTPFGYLNEWKLHVAGDSMAKVFVDL